jgi:hypothetical protein
VLYIRLGDEDRERLGCPEEIEFDPDKLTLVEAEIIDDHGIDWLAIRSGEVVTGPDGKPLTTDDGEVLRRFKPRAQRVWVWCALRRAGIEVDFAELDFDLGAADYRSVRPGKAPSESSDESTP